MESEDESEFSSSSSSGSDSEAESVGEEEEEEEDDDTPSEPKEEQRGGREKRKRKRKVAGHRRDLRSKYESVEDFNPEARSAQTEEIERIRRLELQRSLQTGVPTVMGAVNRGGEQGREGPVVLDLAERKAEREEAIVISSDSEDDVGGGETGGDVGVKRVKLSPEVKSEAGGKERLGRYDVMGESEDGRIVVNLGHGAEEEDVVLAPQIARIIKPHQVGGVRFLYDNLIESLSRFHTSTGFGCILAHSMGLGKTLQVISFIDLFLRHTPAKSVLCVVPVNTLQNWVAEFDKWLPAKEEERKKRGTEKGAGKSRRSLQNGQLLQVPSPSESRRSSSPGLVEVSTVPPSALTMLGGLNFRTAAQSVAMDTSSQVTGMSRPPHPLAHLQNNGNRLPPLTSLFSGENLEKSVFSPPGGNSYPLTFGGSDSRTSSPETPEIQYRSFRLFLLSDTVRSMEARLKTIKQWREEGGVLLIGYEMFRLLSLSVPSLGGNKMAVKRKKSKNQLTQNSSFVDLDENEREMEKLMEIQRGLCVPGPDLVVCDEGHRIKNDYTNISQALKKIQTRRRVVLTGYPLQNNLLEYWCMVDFVRPKYLGTKQEFGDLFERPISNGQCMDSTPEDVRTMRYRSHVLHTLLKGFVLRRGHEILKVTLPSKFEHVLLVRPSPVQALLYDYNMSQMQQGGTSTTAGPLRAFAVCTKIWNHPDIYYNEARAQESRRSSPLSWLDEAGLPKTLLPKSESNSTCRIEWPTEHLSTLPPYTAGQLENSSKMVVAMEILDRSVQVGDKLLIFSQSLSTLSYIENLLSQRHIPIPHSAGPANEVQYSNKKWSKNVNFCRLDGSTGSADRDRLINAFNSPHNQDMWVFLLSTRAGCLGINLVGANRVIVLDVSWNPCYDAQAVCRVYRYGQAKPCHIYRLVCDGTMERKIYDRQISKQGMADRVVDELQPERHFTADEIITLMKPLAPLPIPQDFSPFAHHFSYDHVLTSLCKTLGPALTRLPFKHESLLLDSANERMTEVEKFFAMKGFQQDWNALRRQSSYSLQRHTSVVPHPHQPIAAPSMATPTTTPTPMTSLGTSSYSNTRVGLPTRMLSPPTHLSQSQSGSSLYGPGSSSGMGYGNVTDSPGQRPSGENIICLDLDSDSNATERSAASSRLTPGAAMIRTGSGIIPSGMSHSHATLLPGPKVLTIPISTSTGPAHPNPHLLAQSHHMSLVTPTTGGGMYSEGAMATSNAPPSSMVSSLSQTQSSLDTPSSSSSQPNILSQALSSIFPNLDPHLGQQSSALGQQPAVPGQPVLSKSQLVHHSQQTPIPVSVSGINTPVPGQQMGRPMSSSGQLAPVPGQQMGRPMSNSGQLAPVPGQHMGRPMSNSGQLAPAPGQQMGRPMSKSGQQIVPGEQMGHPMSNPAQLISVPGQQAPIPGQQTPIPGQQAPIPGQHTPIPGQQAPIPGQQMSHRMSTSGPPLETVPYQTAAPGQQTGHPMSHSGHYPTIPGQQASIAGQKVAILGQQASVPNQQTSTLGQQATIPGQKTSIPGHQATIMGQQASIPGQQTSMVGGVSTLHPRTTPSTSAPQPPNLWSSSLVPLTEKSPSPFPPPLPPPAPGDPSLQTTGHQPAGSTHQSINLSSPSPLTPSSLPRTQNSLPFVASLPHETPPTLAQASQQTSGHPVDARVSSLFQQMHTSAKSHVSHSDPPSVSLASYTVGSGGIYSSSKPIMSLGHPILQPSKSVQDSFHPIFSPPRTVPPRDPSQGAPSVPPVPSQKNTHIPSSSPPHHHFGPASPTSSLSAARNLKASFSPPTSSHLHPSQATPSPSPPLTSPRSQPPTPTTSIPLLSPVAAHLFQMSMSKSPRPSPSPSHTPTPSPGHPHPTSSAPLLSPPSATTSGSVSSPVPKNSISGHSPLSPVHHHSNCSPMKTTDSRTLQPHHPPTGLSSYHSSPS